MKNEVLERLTSCDFEIRVIASTAQGFRLLLLRSPEVDSLQKALRTGEVTDSDLRTFVGRLLRKHAGENVFPHQTALSAISVVLERVFTDFAEEYLIDLARVRTKEFAMASRVARVCLEHHSRRPSKDQRIFELGNASQGSITHDFRDAVNAASKPAHLSFVRFEVANA